MPEPDTPVTHVNRPSGIATSTSRRLLPRAPRRPSSLPVWARRVAGTSIERLPERKGPVSEASSRMSRPACPGDDRRRARRRQGRCRPRGRRRGSRPRRARPRSRCCRGRAGAERAEQALVVALVQADARARRGRTSRRPGPRRSARRGGCACRRTASSPAVQRVDSRGRRRPGSSGGSTISLRILSRDLPRRPQVSC